MANKTWVRCKCGAKLHAKGESRKCYVCLKKERKATHVRL